MVKHRPLMFRVDASTQIGTGHLMRCLALAQAWQLDGSEVCFCTNRDLPLALVKRLEAEGIKKIELQAAPGSQEDAQETITYCYESNSQWLVLDGYHFDAGYQQIVKTSNLKLLVIDDYSHTHSYFADLILNQNVYAHAGLYPQIANYTKLLLGCDYALLRREFWSWRDRAEDAPPKLNSNSPLRILITLGGSDPHNTTMTVLAALKYLDLQRIEAKVVVGGSNPHLDLLESLCNSLGNVASLHCNVTNMPDLMAHSDLAIAAGGSTCWELALMGIPALLIILAENQRLIAEELDGLGIGINLGWHLEITPENIATEIVKLLDNRDRLTLMSKKAVELVDGYGSQRTVDYMKSQSL
jgi:UDP-2,4-diacetamido-2,4,6-trideoxy-beta-L-altropyranose hydrolase